MVENVWRNKESETVVPLCFYESHINGKCISIEKIKMALNKFTFKQDGFNYINVDRFKNELNIK
jgi:hypothetical protein